MKPANIELQIVSNSLNCEHSGIMYPKRSLISEHWGRIKPKSYIRTGQRGFARTFAVFHRVLC